MSSRRTHESTGTIAALQAYVSQVQRNGLPPDPARDLLAVTTARWMGTHIAMLPDLLEPAGSPDHRGFFHSVDVVRILEKMNLQTQVNPESDLLSRIIVEMAVAAYRSHIELDSRTTMSVPDYTQVMELLSRLNKQ